MAFQFATCVGLSPRVRGNRPGPLADYAGKGSIPACAGEPHAPSPGVHPGGVYPRVCGGTNYHDWQHRRRRGLSPRVRGNLEVRRDVAAGERSIPACAGEPKSLHRPQGRQLVYPRVCGGTAAPRRYAIASRGLSPRVRGNPGPARRLPGPERSIPACAGEPFGPPHSGHRYRVYPRVCGGTRCNAGARGCDPGLSPRVRGNPGYRYRTTMGSGSIPACAGEPV